MLRYGVDSYIGLCVRMWIKSERCGCTVHLRPQPQPGIGGGSGKMEELARKDDKKKKRAAVKKREEV